MTYFIKVTNESDKERALHLLRTKANRRIVELAEDRLHRLLPPFYLVYDTKTNYIIKYKRIIYYHH